MNEIKSVHEEHKYLYHYTSHDGLLGIIQSRSLWATNIGFLNDAEEFVGYFDRRLPVVCHQAMTNALLEASSKEEVARQITMHGGIEGTHDFYLQPFLREVKRLTTTLHDPFVFSFSVPPDEADENDGYLSLWQAYGMNGGYALVFRSTDLVEMIRAEHRNYLHQFIQWCDVEYFNQFETHEPRHVETRMHEDVIRKVVAKIPFGMRSDEYEPLFTPINYLACSHKHRGFAHEREVRIVSALPNGELAEQLIEHGDKRPRKQVHFYQKRGTPVPFIKLFEGQDRLPLFKVIVGPHAEKHNRKIAVQALLRAHRINAEVVVSDIPYIG